MKQNSWVEPERYLADDTAFSKLGLNVCKRTVDQASALHWHEYCEIELILKGKMIHHLNNKSSVIEAGNLYFLTPSDFHKIEPIEPIEIINISFKESLIPIEFLAVFMGKQRAANTLLPPDTFQFLRAITEKLYEEFHQDRAYRTCYLKSLLNCLFSEISYASPSAEESETNHLPDPIRRALMYIYCNFRENPSLHTVASTVGLCDNYFCETFHKATGQKFNRFLNNLKLQHAYDILVNSEKPITEICFSSGFDSMTHFQREFKAKYHRSPSEMRKQQKVV